MVFVNIALTGGSGFIGRRTRDALRHAGYSVRLVSTRTAPGPRDLAGCGAVIHLAVESVAQRWTASARERIRNSRVEGTRALVAAMRSEPPAVLISASA